MDQVKIKITEDNNGLTIKEFLKKCNVGRPMVEKIRVNKLSSINNIQKDIETVLKTGDVLSLSFDEKIDFAPDFTPIDVVYEDDYLLVVNKQPGIIIYNEDKNQIGSLANMVAGYYENNNICRNIRYIHRLDKETSGIVIFAKDFLTEAMMLKQLQEDKILKEYLAFVENKIKKHGTIKAKIGKDRHVNGKMVISSTGKDAFTEYKLIKEYDNYSLVSFRIHTGRTHQIRVHSSSIGNPILGDVLYGGNMIYISRVALHASHVIFTHPFNCSIIDLKAKMPADMEKLRND